MKDLSIEEKAKRYNEAINAIKELEAKHSTAPVIKDWIKENFPELQESEDDEQIRKAIVNHLLELSKSRVNLMTKATYENWITWLEKQDVQKADKCEDCNNVKGCITCTDGDQYVHIKEYNSAWSEEDKENISMLIDLVESKEESMEVKIELSAWLKSLKERIQPQSMK